MWPCYIRRFRTSLIVWREKCILEESTQELELRRLEESVCEGGLRTGIVRTLSIKLYRLDIESKAREHSIPVCIIADAGLTQIKEGSLTVCGLGPAPTKMVNIITGDLKLL